MTFFGLLASLAWAVVVLAIAHRAEKLVIAMWSDWINSAHPLPLIGASARAQLSKREITIPDDLEAVALAESEPWAQADTRELMKEKYLEYHTGDSAATWQKVRRAMGIGELP